MVTGLPLLRVPVPGTRVAVRVLGAGAPLVLLHGGMGTSLHDWGPVARRFAEHRQVVLVDWRAHGCTPAGADLPGLHRFALDLTHVVRALGGAAVDFVGFSMGANAVLHLLARRPELARSAVLVGGSAQGDPARIRGYAQRPWPQELLGLHDGVDGGNGYTRWLRHVLIADWAANCSMADEQLARVTCPVLVCHGDRDRMQRLEEALDLVRRLPRAQLYVVPNAGHAVQLDAPELFATAVEAFLQGPARQ